MKFSIPKEVRAVAETLTKNNLQAFLVGGCVRDLLMHRVPKDWDIATDAIPEEIQKLFEDSVYENTFGTVGIKTESEDSTLKIIEITTFRTESAYTDKRHPDRVQFAKTIEEDLSRRDFTVNAMALKMQNEKIKNQNDNAKLENLIDPYGGEGDLKKKVVRAVGKPEDRFEEDALRLMRAVRFAAQLYFSIEEKTKKAIKEKAGLLEYVSKERIRDELTKLIMAPGAVAGILALVDMGLMKFILPELLEGISVGQNKHHIFTVFEHNLKSFQYAVDKNFTLDLRLASLLHDVGKPRVKKGNGPNSTFYGHQVVGEHMVVKMLDRLHLQKAITERVALLVREHMFVYDPDVVTEAGVRRLLRRVGKENTDDLVRLREADRIGSGVPKAQPYRLRYLKAMIEKVQKDPVHPKMLKIRGEAIMEILKIAPGPRVGKILAILLEEVLDNPELNDGEILKPRIEELGSLTDGALDVLAAKAKKKAVEAQNRIDDEIKKKYFVK
jgi:poly(A) polymerase/tRNA nucleotidyltransferase (CCA-adding enzyme)